MASVQQRQRQQQQQHHNMMSSTRTPPIETKVSMDKDYDYYIAKYNTQPPPPPPPQQQQHPPKSRSPTKISNQVVSSSSIGSGNNLGAVPMQPVLEQQQHPQQQQQQRPMRTPPRPPAVTPPPTTTPQNTTQSSDGSTPPSGAGEKIDSDEALLDLAQLEELHHEAERMKALGNKHMAAQEYTRAYNAYSAALQLSPVGPSSHVFLSNRSAALLSLKRYSAAATDARRAIALAPTFGKAHARLGQSLYFLKEYEGAVTAYEDAIHYEPDNPITRTYLEKAKTKLHRQLEKAARANKGEEISVLTAESSVQATVINSVATDPNASAAVVQTMGFRGQSDGLVQAVGGSLRRSPVATGAAAATGVARGLDAPIPDEDEDDPDFDEALRIQERANKYLANKNYKYAIEEYTAALFLVPDDENLSPDLHLGRAHGLNGSRRHESAMIDAKLAIKIRPSPEAYSTLAKSLFYMKDYQGAVDAFTKCKEMLPEGESLSMFDRAYLQKAEAALQAALQSDESSIAARSTTSSSTPIPKLKPPRFVPREEALSRAPNMPSMPKAWPQQSPKTAQVLQCGPEREVLFLSEALGIKLNRGPDGIVRIIDVSPDVPGSPIARKGEIAVGDVIREAAGVDIRRPITNIMWGDTVALIKMAPRPIMIIVAKELNPTDSILSQRKNAAANSLSPTSASHFFPSNASGEESVKEHMKNVKDAQEALAGVGLGVELTGESEAAAPSIDEVKTAENSDQGNLSDGGNLLDQVVAEEESKDASGTQDVAAAAEKGGDDDKERETCAKSEVDSDSDTKEDGKTVAISNQQNLTTTTDTEDSANQGNKLPENVESDPKCDILANDENKPHDVEPEEGPTSNDNQSGQSASTQEDVSTLRDKEYSMIGAEIYFGSDPNLAYGGWDNLRFMSYSGTRKVRFCEPVFRLKASIKSMFWSGDQYVERKLAIYDEPNIILVLRPVEGLAEMREILGLPVGAKVEDPKKIEKSYLVVESVIDPKASKLRLSPLTTATSFVDEVEENDARRQSCYEIISPFENCVLSSVRLRKGAERALTSFSDSGAFLETSSAEHALQLVITRANAPSDGVGKDFSWKHQIILGTLHSFVVLGNQSALDRSIAAAMSRSKEDSGSGSKFLDSRVVDELDESGRAPLHYACSTRFASAVASLVNAGANVDLKIEENKMSPCHICAMNLDDKSLSIILEKNRRPNVLDGLGRTPISLAIFEGRSLSGQRNAGLLRRCLMVLNSHGAELENLAGRRHPVSYLSSVWLSEDLAAVLDHVNYRYPLLPSNGDSTKQTGISVDAFFEYPVHSCLVCFREEIQLHMKNVIAGNQEKGWRDRDAIESSVLKTLEVLFKYGFEPNERLEGLVDQFEGCGTLLTYTGFAPIQILASSSHDALDLQKDIGETEYLAIEGSIMNVVEFLIKTGARISLDPPPESRRGAQGNTTDVSSIKIHPLKEVANLLGSYRLKTSEMAWQSSKSVNAVRKYVLHVDKLPIEDSMAPGGSDEKSCSICWKPFGTLRNRKHRCRMTRRYVCDECSTKRVTVDGEEHRVIDGQFLLVKADGIRQHELEMEQSKREKEAQAAAAAARLERLEAEEASKRGSLFGGAMESMTGVVASVARAVGGVEADAEPRTTSSDVQGLSESLGQTRDALNERGEKLNSLADKSDKLVEASKDFASMAAELNKQSQKGLFW